MKRVKIKTKQKNDYLRFGLAFFLSNITCLFSLGAALYMAVNEVKGWGWFIVVALITAVSISTKEKNDDSDE